MDAFMGTIMPVGFNYSPRGWLFCNGQTISIAQNSAMFALLGTMYGGDGQQTFGIPDLRGRTVVGSQAQGPGLENVSQGEKAGTNNDTVISNGTATITLTQANMPTHTHTATMSLTGLTATTTVNVAATNTGTAVVNPVANSLLGASPNAPSASSASIFLPPLAQAPATVALGGVSTTVTGSGSVTNANAGNGTSLTVPVVSSATISNMQPYLGLNFIIAMEGIFPSRN